MLTLLDTLTSFIAPHQCLACDVEGDLLCQNCLPLLPDIQPQCYRCHRTDKGNTTCKSCRSSSPLQQVWVRTTYEGFGEALVGRLKFERAYAAAGTIAQSMAELPLPSDVMLVPIPTATSRVRQRGYDQAVLIARQLSKHTGIRCRQLLERHGQQRQTGHTRKLRKVQLADAFHVRDGKIKNTRSVILIDDVLTTGATIEAAAQALRQHGIKHVSAAIFARTE